MTTSLIRFTILKKRSIRYGNRKPSPEFSVLKHVNGKTISPAGDADFCGRRYPVGLPRLDCCARMQPSVYCCSMREAIEMAWEHGGAEFHGMFDKATAQATEMKQGALRVL